MRPISDNRRRMDKGVTSRIGRTSMVVQRVVEQAPTSLKVTGSNNKVRVTGKITLGANALFVNLRRIINQSVTSLTRKGNGYLNRLCRGGKRGSGKHGTIMQLWKTRQSVAFYTGFSRVFHHCIMVPYFPLPRFPPPAFLTLPRFPLLRFQSPRQNVRKRSR